MGGSGWRMRYRMRRKVFRRGRLRWKGFAALALAHGKAVEARGPQTNNLCWYCGRRPARTVDHFCPASRNGMVLSRDPAAVAAALKRFGPGGAAVNGFHQENLIPACRECNTAKAALPLWRWVPELVGRFELRRPA